MHFSLSENSFVMQTQCVVEKLEHCLRQQLRMVNVYSHVRKNYKSAELLMLSATKAYFCCVFMQWAGLEELGGTLANITLPKETSSKEERWKFIMDTIVKFVEEFLLLECNIEKVWREQHEQPDLQLTFHLYFFYIHSSDTKG